MDEYTPATLLYSEQQEQRDSVGTYLHQHKDFWQLQWFTQGEVTALLGEGSDCLQLKVEKDCLLLIPPEASHGIEAKEPDGGQISCYDLKFRVNDEHLADILKRIPPKIAVEESLRMLLTLLLNSEKQDTRDAYLTAALYRIVELKPLREEVKKIRHAKASFIAKKYIEQHCCEHISTESICQELGYNKSYLCTAFKKDFHLTISEYIMVYKIKTASEMLAYSDKGIRDIAEETGFKSVTHFCRVFKEHTGHSPKQFRLMQA